MTDPYMNILHRSLAHTVMMLVAIGLMLVVIAGALTIPLDGLGVEGWTELNRMRLPPPY